MSDTSSEELHIASFIVHCWPDHLDAIKAQIDQTEGLETGAESPEGKLVVIAEGPHQQRLLETVELLESQPGVLECILVYHELMSAAEAGHEMIDLKQTQ
ncbi:chaperone NapD [Marinobacter sp. HL-58]|uniref:chaperone NapD n=1 Tax=Marinobacter sp. HL-58 TaxID=1479237 RepID=UPI00068B4916|nr:chaperone NapD [Marinobacter sp. HL-58]KPP98062.1 MAG: periplasmic nitrate reductase chpaerone NapD [Marinobacter sp. HL-58]